MPQPVPSTLPGTTPPGAAATTPGPTSPPPVAAVSDLRERLSRALAGLLEKFCPMAGEARHIQDLL
ncbi:hypothetical protein [Micromonospora sonchi]|uniref:hypothetical protein n=1 Tax=Micromonospora sonchi TaxID=1763543 RepID=UPI0016683DF2|nr:hypothetical protein [Micromonospora sonchi]